MKKLIPSIGIDDMSIYIPRLYLSIETLAKERKINYEKLHKGLGLERMAVPDVHEDAATMAANAIADLIEKNELAPQDIGRIYLGTESAVDGSKPTATYALEMLRSKYCSTYGEDCFLNCDVVDLTFACIGGIDALQNTLDWVRGEESRIGIVVCSDYAKYELDSTGEYTQGAGAVALLIKHQPRLMAIADTFGVATMGIHDFYKPLHPISKKQIIEEVLNLAGITNKKAEDILNNLPETLKVNNIIDSNEAILTLHKDTPIFDGPLSNQTYQNRIREAYSNFRQKMEQQGQLTPVESTINRWSRLVFHLPYASHARRIFSEIYMIEKKLSGDWDSTLEEVGCTEPTIAAYEQVETYNKDYGQFLKAITKTRAYKAFVKEKMEKSSIYSGQIGNMYTCSIFVALMSTLDHDYSESIDLTGHQLGFFGYGSGSKSKVFEGTIQPRWREVVSQFNVKKLLKQQTEISYSTYERLHRKQVTNSISAPNGAFAITEVEQKGIRNYSWIPATRKYSIIEQLPTIINKKKAS